MNDSDRERAPSTRRLVIYGPPLAGKSSLLAALARAASVKPTSGRIRNDALAEIVLRAHLRPDFEIAAINGGVFFPESWVTLLDEATDVVLLLDPQETRLEANRKVLRAMAERHRELVRGVVWSKDDLATSGVATSTSLDEINDLPKSAQQFRARIDRPSCYGQIFEAMFGWRPSSP